MKTRYKYIHFVEDNGCWRCRNNKQLLDVLGHAGYYPQWKQYVFAPRTIGTVFSHDCLTDIAHFLQQLNEKK